MARRKVQPSAPTTEPAEIRVEYTALSKVAKWPKNPKRHDAGQLGASMSRWGFTSPILINESTGVLVAGHGRVEELERRKAAGEPAPERIRVERGEWYVPVVRGVGFASDDEAAAYAVADNRLVELGGWDDALLADALGDLDCFDGIGFAESDIAGMHGQVEKQLTGLDGLQETVTEEHVEIVPFTKTHVLLSFSPDVLAKLAPHLEAIRAVAGVEYEQGSNG